MEINERSPTDHKTNPGRRRKLPLLLLLGVAATLLSSYGIWRAFNPPVPTAVADDLISSIDLEASLPSDGAGTSAPQNVPAPANDGEMKALEERKKALQEQAGKSPHKGAIKANGETDCEQILKDFEAEIEKSIKAKQISPKLLDTTNDPFLIKCQKDPEFMRRFNEVYNKLLQIPEE